MSSNQKATGLFNEAALRYFRGRSSEAEQLLKQAIAEDPNFAFAYRNLGMLSRNKGFSADAIKYIEKARELGDQPDVDICTSLGASYFMEGRYEEAIQELKEALTFDDNNAEARYWLGLANNIRGHL